MSPGWVGVGLLPYKRLNGDVPLVTFSKELLEWGRTLSDFLG